MIYFASITGSQQSTVGRGGDPLLAEPSRGVLPAATETPEGSCRDVIQHTVCLDSWRAFLSCLRLKGDVALTWWLWKSSCSAVVFVVGAMHDGGAQASSGCRTGDLGCESSPWLEAPLNLLLDPALFKLLVEVVKVKVPRRPPSRRTPVRGASGGLDGELSLSTLLWLDIDISDRELLALRRSDGALSRVNVEGRDILF